MTKPFIEPDYDPKYIQLLDALIEYLDSIGQREVTTISQRDITIIKALIEFYDFEVYDNQDIIDIMDDVKERVKELDLTDEEE
jgi:hypothetical protein